MCWEMDYEFFAQLEKAKKAETAQKQRDGVINDLLSEANKQAESAKVETTPADEVVPAK